MAFRISSFKTFTYSCENNDYTNMDSRLYTTVAIFTLIVFLRAQVQVESLQTWQRCRQMEIGFDPSREYLKILHSPLQVI